MKCCNKIWKILGVLVAVTATILVIVKFWDKILDSLTQLKEKAGTLRTLAQALEQWVPANLASSRKKGLGTRQQLALRASTLDRRGHSSSQATGSLPAT